MFLPQGGCCGRVQAALWNSLPWLVGWEGPGVVWETRRNITSQDGKPTEKVIHVRILVCKSAFQTPWICWNAWHKTGREGEHKALLLSDCSYSISWISFQSFLNCAEFQFPSLCEREFGCCILQGFPCFPVDLLENTNHKFIATFQEIPYRN